ncbi:MAG: hypothetical protein M3065_09520 [Actinomycetota bacterium]|nr:hypothetical protein [Actinomycetota bacterium]
MLPVIAEVVGVAEPVADPRSRVRENLVEELDWFMDRVIGTERQDVAILADQDRSFAGGEREQVVIAVIR